MMIGKASLSANDYRTYTHIQHSPRQIYTSVLTGGVAAWVLTRPVVGGVNFERPAPIDGLVAETIGMHGLLEGSLDVELDALIHSLGPHVHLCLGGVGSSNQSVLMMLCSTQTKESSLDDDW